VKISSQVEGLLIAEEDFLIRRKLLGHPLLQASLLGHELGVAAEQDVRAAPGHVGGNRDHSLTAGLRHDIRLALVLLGVQDLVLNPHPLETGGQLFRLLDGDGAHQHGLALLLAGFDLLGGVAEFLFFGAVDDVRIL
jgi:hypothetical protein